MPNLTAEERALVADALAAYAEGVDENLRDDDWPGEPRDSYPVVEDYQADADRIRAGETPLHEASREVLVEVAEIADDPAAFSTLVARLLETAATTLELTIPYGLTRGELVLEPDCKLSWVEALEELTAEDEAWHDVDAARVLTAAVLVHQKTGAPLGACLETALVWERG